MGKAWRTATIVAVLGFLGLFVASGAQSGSFYVIGLGVFIASVLYVFATIRWQVGNPTHHEDEPEAS